MILGRISPPHRLSLVGSVTLLPISITTVDKFKSIHVRHTVPFCRIDLIPSDPIPFDPNPWDFPQDTAPESLTLTIVSSSGD